MLFVLLHFCLNECSLQHTKKAMRKMSVTYINSQPKLSCSVISLSQWRTQEFCSKGGSTNSVEDRENRDLEAVAP